MIGANSLTPYESNLNPRAARFTPLRCGSLFYSRLNATAPTFYPWSAISQLNPEADQFVPSSASCDFAPSTVSAQQIGKPVENVENEYTSSHEEESLILSHGPLIVDSADAQPAKDISGVVADDSDVGVNVAWDCHRDLISSQTSEFGPSSAQLRLQSSPLPPSSTECTTVTVYEQHHVNFMGDIVPCKSGTSSALSLAILTMLPKRHLSPRSADYSLHNYVTTTNAWKLIDPVVFFGNPLVLQYLSGSDLRNEATGQTSKVYLEYGDWMSDQYDEDEELPETASQISELDRESCVVFDGEDRNDDEDAEYDTPNIRSRNAIWILVEKAQLAFETARREKVGQPTVLQEKPLMPRHPLRTAYTPDTMRDEEDAEAVEAADAELHLRYSSTPDIIHNEDDGEGELHRKFLCRLVGRLAARAARIILPGVATQIEDSDNSSVCSTISSLSSPSLSSTDWSQLKRSPLQIQDILRPTSRAWSELDDDDDDDGVNQQQQASSDSSSATTCETMDPQADLMASIVQLSGVSAPTVYEQSFETEEEQSEKQHSDETDLSVLPSIEHMLSEDFVANSFGSLRPHCEYEESEDFGNAKVFGTTLVGSYVLPASSAATSISLSTTSSSTRSFASSNGLLYQPRKSPSLIEQNFFADFSEVFDRVSLQFSDNTSGTSKASLLLSDQQGSSTLVDVDELHLSLHSFDSQVSLLMLAEEPSASSRAQQKGTRMGRFARWLFQTNTTKPRNTLKKRTRVNTDPHNDDTKKGIFASITDKIKGTLRGRK